MNKIHKLFQETSQEEKVNFFLTCQKILTNYHPNSPFIFNEKNIQSRLQATKDLITNYNGFCFYEDNICILYNKIKIDDPKNVILAIKNNMFKKLSQDFNAIIIDFITFKETQNCLNFCQEVYNPQMQYVIFVKNNKPKIYSTVELMQNLFKLPQSQIN